MGGKTSRTKGAVFEREIAARFSTEFEQEQKRNIGQARDGGSDIDVGPLVVECKRRKTLGTVYGWLRQAIAATAAKPAHKQLRDWFGKETQYDLARIPVVVAREDQGEPIVIMRLSDFFVVCHGRVDDWVHGKDR